MTDLRDTLSPYECPSCKNIHKWLRAGIFCRMTCFYKWLGTNQEKLNSMKAVTYTSSRNALEKLQENA